METLDFIWNALSEDSLNRRTDARTKQQTKWKPTLRILTFETFSLGMQQNMSH